MTLKTERLTVRDIEAGDWRSIKEIWEDFNASEYVMYDMPHGTDDEDVRRRVAAWVAACVDEHRFFAVCLGGTVIGFCAFNARGGGYELSYAFRAAYQGKGYARESIAAAIGYMRDNGTVRFMAGTALANVPSVSLLRALGFCMVGTEKVSFYRDESGRDVVFDGGLFELAFAD